MRRYLIKWILPAILLIAAAAISVPALQRNTAQTVEPAPNQMIQPVADGYFLQLDGMLLSVYRNGENTPLIQHEILPSLLPEEDRQRLEEGVSFTSLEELRQRLEDYLG